MHVVVAFVLALAVWFVAYIISGFSILFLWCAPLVISGLTLLFCTMPRRRPRMNSDCAIWSSLER